MSKLSNALYMIELLSTGKKYSIEELANILEVTPRMIRVYKDEIEKAGIYIDSIKGPYGGYILNSNITLPKRYVKKDELVIQNKEIYNLICLAIKNKNKVYLEYYDKNFKNISKRIVRPYEIIMLNNDLGVAAYCELKEEIRHFYLDRIKVAKIKENF